MTEEKKQLHNLSELGEFKLIEHLTKEVKVKNSSTKFGIGDDAAVLNHGGKSIVVTTDLLTEGIHFNLVYSPLKHLGYKSAVVNFSDVFAMNATPKQLTISMAISKKFSLEALTEFYDGLLLACEEYGADLVGGDTSSSLTGMTVSITVIGEADTEKITYRDGAKENDLICVSGDLGAAYLGLQLLERERKIFESGGTAQPDLTGYEYILRRQLKPEARKDVVEYLRKEGILPTSMIDISDGLSSELLHICENSKVGCQIYADKIPIDTETAKMAEEMNLEPITCALNGGEDYELLFTVPLTDHDKISKIPGISIIGHITKSDEGSYMITPNGDPIAIMAQGWQGFPES